MGKIVSRIVLVLPDGSKKEYSSGEELVGDHFDIAYAVKTIGCKEDK